MAFLKTLWADRQTPKVTGAQLNRIEQGVFDAHNPPSAKVHIGAAQNTNDGATHSPAFDVEDFDAFGMHSGADGHLTIVKPGLWHLSAGVTFNSSGTGRRAFVIDRYTANGAAFIERIAEAEVAAAFATTFTQVSVDGYARCALNERISVFTIQNSGGILALNAGSGTAHGTWLAARWCGD